MARKASSSTATIGLGSFVIQDFILRSLLSSFAAACYGERNGEWIVIRHLPGRHRKGTRRHFRRDLHPDLRADYVFVNPPFNDSDWFRKDDDVRCICCDVILPMSGGIAA